MSDPIIIRSKLEGADQLIVEINRVGLSVKGTTRKAVRAGSKVIQAEAERRAAPLSSRKGKSVRIKVSSPARGNVTGQIGPGEKKWYLRFFETGTKAGPRVSKRGFFYFKDAKGRRIAVKRINHPGVAARPWLRPAFDAAQNRARDAFGEALVKAIAAKRAENDNGPEEE